MKSLQRVKKIFKSISCFTALCQLRGILILNSFIKALLHKTPFKVTLNAPFLEARLLFYLFKRVKLTKECLKGDF